MRTAEIVIVGGGVIGCSVAYHLAKRGQKGILVLEREPLIGSMSTSKAVGGIRAQFSTEINIRLSQVSIPVFEKFEEEFEYPIDYRQFGYLWLIADEKAFGHFKRSAEKQRALGVPAEILTPEQAKEIVPQIRTDDLVGATYSGKDGIADPNGVVQGFAKQAKKLGVSIEERVEVTGIAVAGGRIAGVATNGGPISCPRVVCCAGAWSAPLGKMAGIEIPVRPFRRQYFVTAPIAGLPERMPLTIDTKTGVYVKPEAGGLLLGKIDPNEPPGYGTSPNWDFLDQIVEPAIHRFPVLETAEVITGVAGLYEETPDHHPIIEKIDSPAGLYVTAGFSGHGIMHSPAAGMLTAELILDGKPSLDLSAISMSRFARGALIDETNVI